MDAEVFAALITAFGGGAIVVFKFFTRRLEAYETRRDLEVESLRSEKDRLTTQVANLEVKAVKVDSLEDNLTSLFEQLKDYQTRLKIVEDKLEAKEQEVQRLRSERDTAREQVADLKHTTSRLEIENEVFKHLISGRLEKRISTDDYAKEAAKIRKGEGKPTATGQHPISGEPAEAVQPAINKEGTTKRQA